MHLPFGQRGFHRPSLVDQSLWGECNFYKMNIQKGPGHIVVRNRYFPGLILIIQDEYTKNMKDTHLFFAVIRDVRPW